jgi:hypothetical protein
VHLEAKSCKPCGLGAFRQRYGLTAECHEFLATAYQTNSEEEFRQAITGGSGQIKIKRLLLKSELAIMRLASKASRQERAVEILRKAYRFGNSTDLRDAMLKLNHPVYGKVTREEIDLARRIYGGNASLKEIAVVYRLVAATRDVGRGGNIVPGGVRDAYGQMDNCLLLLTPKATEPTPGPRRFAPVHPSSTWQSDCEVG